MPVQWYYKIMGQEHGPVTSSQLKSLADDNRIDRDTHIRRSDQDTWHLADEVQKLFSPPHEKTGNMGDDIPDGKSRNASEVRG